MKTRELWVVAPERAEIREASIARPAPGLLGLRTLYTAVSKGTESLVFTGRVPVSEWQRMRAPGQEGEFSFPIKYGYINVARVESGPDEWMGKCVFSLSPHQSWLWASPTSVCALPEGLDPKRAILAAGMETAVNAIWDAGIQVGDKVVVIGGGVIGCLCAYLAARIPGAEVQLVDTEAARAPIAQALGVGFTEAGAALEDADVVVHASGNAAGLQAALDCVGLEGRVVELSWYGDQQVALALGQAFHSQRLTIRASQVGRLPASHQARWSHARRMRLSLRLLRDPALEVLITGESRFADLPGELGRLFKDPAALCHRVRFPEGEPS